MIAVLTGEDAAADGVKPITHSPVANNPYEHMIKGGDVVFVAPHPPLPADRARCVGEVVAMVVAETPGAARDGAERVVVEWTPLPAVTTSLAAAAPGAPILYDGPAQRVRGLHRSATPRPWTRLFSRAPRGAIRDVVRGHRGDDGAARGRRVWDEASGRYTVHGRGRSGRTQPGVAGALGVPESVVRVPRARSGKLRDAQQLLCRVRAVPGRAAPRRPVNDGRAAEAFQADYGASDLVSHAELALDADGYFLAFRAANTSNVGAHAVSYHPLNKGMSIATTVYRVPVVSLHGRCVNTNTSPTTPYRSAGRPEVMYVMERLIDLAARRHGFDRVELRRRNLIAASAMPHENAMGVVYDSGDYRAALDRTLVLSDWAGFEPPRRSAPARPVPRDRRGQLIEINTASRASAPHHRASEGRVDQSSARFRRSGSRDELSAAPRGMARGGARAGPLITGDTDVTVVGGGAHSARALRLAPIVMAKGRIRSSRRARASPRGCWRRGRRHRILRAAVHR